MSAGSARGRGTGPPPASDRLFATRWIHAFEEDTPESEVYRPETEDVPLSRRPRRRLSFAADGSASVLLPGPDDRLVERAAAWRKEGGDIVVSSETAGGGPRQELRIVERSPDRLVVRK